MAVAVEARPVVVVTSAAILSPFPKPKRLLSLLNRREQHPGSNSLHPVATHPKVHPPPTTSKPLLRHSRVKAWVFNALATSELVVMVEVSPWPWAETAVLCPAVAQVASSFLRMTVLLKISAVEANPRTLEPLQGTLTVIGASLTTRRRLRISRRVLDSRTPGSNLVTVPVLQ
jgi:hypothetical protein